MRSSGAVYRKLKEAKFRRLVNLYKKLFRRIPDNCGYNYEYKFTGSDNKPYTIKLCMIHQNYIDFEKSSHLIDVCQTAADCEQCDAFLPRYTKEQVKGIFEEELKTKNVKEMKYPEICALEWVLERSVVGIPPINRIQALYFKIKNTIFRNIL